MRACILLSVLQRNFKPFIENQLRCVIDKYKLDLFIYTSDENVLRYSTSGYNTIDYKMAKSFDTNYEFFRNTYSSLKGMYIDYNNNLFTEYLKQHNIQKHRNHTTNMISSYFKINGCISLMEEYEKKQGFQYDIVMRCRLDFYSCDDDFVNPFQLDREIIYLPISRFNRHRDDSGFIMKREYIDYVKDFINVIIEYDDTLEYIIIESQWHNYLKLKYKILYIPNFAYRIGVGCKPRTIPYIRNIELLESIEYKSEL